MALYTFGGTPADVLTTATGDVVPDYPLLVRVAGTGELVTALYEIDGTTPIGELRTNPSSSPQPGAVRPFKCAVPAIDYEYLDGGGDPIRWYQAGREVAQEALAAASDALSTSEGGTVEGPLVAAGGLDVEGALTAENAIVSGGLSVGGTFTAEGGIDLSGMQVFNPMIWGTGAAALQAALNSARDADGGGWVIVPGDEWMITATLRTYGNTRLTLLPGVKFLRDVAATMLINGDADQSFGGYTGHGNITIEGGTWDMRGTTVGLTGSAMCISIGHARDIEIRDVEIRDVSGFHAIELNSTKNATIERCRFLGYVDPGARDFSEAVQFDLAKSSGVFGGFGPYDNTVCEDITMRDCYVGASGTAGTTAWPRGVGSHSATVDVAHRRIKIEGNSFEGCLQYGVVAYAYNDSTISGNTMRNCGSGIRCRTIISADAADSTNTSGVVTNASQVMENLTIDRNVIVDCTGYDDPILLYGETTGRIAGVTITGNTVDGAADGENGIRIFYTSDYTVSSNVVRGVEGTAISQEQVVGGVIGMNRIYDPGGSGISCDTGTGISIDTNQVRDAGVNGIHIIGGSDVQVQNNYVKGASRNASGSWGIRCSTSADGLLITGNKVRKYGSGNEIAAGLGITSTCTNVKRYGNDFGDTGIDDQSTAPNTSPFDSGFGGVEDSIRPAGRYETNSRLRCGTTSTPTSGTLYLVPVWLPKGAVISNIGFVSGGTAASAPTNYWFTLHDRAKVALARTADQLTAAWAANTAKSLAIAQTTAGAASSYTTTYAGLHYYGVMIKATTVPSLVSEGSVADVLASVAPGFGGTDTGQTTPPTVTGSAFTAGSFGAGSGILLYGYGT
ncbi:right-handed parallel beta-helix repeat-containing protein [Streptomyces europaeiscabiei]|uniref:right-handed parallel beta-helix repeat-containing protein n=1 Tax=Streptomyces europaeiscabiei TaxID=146819 RepID=UPI002E185EAF